MDLNYDYRDFQKETMNRLARIYAESLNEEDDTISEETYNKIQKILDCKEMEQCHPYLYTLDRLHLNECDLKKVNKLYECGVQRGFIEEDQDTEHLEAECMGDCDDTSLCGGPDDSLTNQPFPQVKDQVSIETKPTFNIIYSAIKDGEEKSGEFYSNKDSKDAARIDCLKQLQSQGYNNITVVAIEQNVDAINQDIQEEPAGENLYDIYQEDDSSEYEKQETGDTDDNQETPNTNTQGGDDTADSKNQDTDDTDVSKDQDTQNDSTSEETDSKEADNEETQKDEPSDTEEDSGDDTETEEDDEEKDSDDDKSEENSEDEKDDEKEEKKLTAEEKENLRGEYSKIFKEVLGKVTTDKSVSEMNIQEKIDFLTKLQEKWTKNDPNEFMNTKDQEKLDKFVAKPEEKETK